MEDSSYMKLNFKAKFMAPVPNIDYNIDFLIEKTRIHISIWIGKNRRGREKAFDYYPISKDVAINLENIHKKFTNKMETIDAYFDLVGDEYVDKIINASGGVEKIFRLTIATIF
jgi:translation initiation factor 2B subunit (eIF-2B alpha/beta/delta family)